MVSFLFICFIIIVIFSLFLMYRSDAELYYKDDNLWIKPPYWKHILNHNFEQFNNIVEEVGQEIVADAIQVYRNSFPKDEE